MMTREEKRKREQEIINRAKRRRERFGGNYFRIPLDLNDPFSEVANVTYESGKWRIRWQDEVTLIDETWDVLIAEGLCKSAACIW